MSGQHHRNRRKPRNDSRNLQFRGAAKLRKARWLRARRRLAELKCPPTVRAIFAALFDVALRRLDCEGIFLGFGGYRNNAEKERIEAARAAGRGPKPGLADVSGCSRRSAIRFRHRIVKELGLVLLVPGGGTRPDGSAIGGRGLANEYRLDDGPPPAPALPPEPAPDPRVQERGRALVREAASRIGGPRGP